MVQSRSRIGCALDNAAAESFSSTLKVEFAHRHHFVTRAEARVKIAIWIADFYNARRRHSPADERRITAARAASRAKAQQAIAAEKRLHGFRELPITDPFSSSGGGC
ncbi:integrase core domain-containing protein [Nonomuraea recticatena]|uniref:Integrase catalytic domain-containing protein n=1 Tax=Nonomuraea recticatena TaxID=46178 RepID=A0ABP6FXV1_9ACTN